MSQEEWDAMSGQEKFNYLNESRPEVKMQNVMNGKARVGDPDAIRTVYSVFRGHVQTGESYSLDEANQQDKESLDYWKTNKG